MFKGLCNGSEVPHSYSWQLARLSHAVSCPMELTSVNMYRAGPRRSESRQAPQRDRGRQGADGDKGVARIGWGRMSGLNGTKVDKGFSIPHRTRKGSIRGTSAAYHAAWMCLASNVMNLGKDVMQQGWIVDPASGMLTVKKQLIVTEQKLDSSKLQRLTEYVFHLEH
ncbi:hypothetical protein GH714_017997 [Hevea brasiliensis]|uniref:Uncharacterized protein n=1 Tax=Hevea brasiliensis TaxID=3981 RepID=A0A6A6N0F7_HEVBR|nr:hypothetical protein GH714_017997 [Hevea brasiliensis]